MDEITAVFIASGIGAIAGLGGALMNAWFQSKLEYTKWVRARVDSHAEALKDAMQQFATKLAAGVHSMCWLTWIAKEKPSRLTQERIDQHDSDSRITCRYNGFTGNDNFA